MDKVSGWIRLHVLQIIAVVFWLGVIGLVYIYVRSNNLTLGQFFALLERLMTEPWYGMLLFFAVVVLLRPFTLVPAMAFVTVAGYVFGLWIGFVAGHFAMTASALLPYYFGRLFPVNIHDSNQHGRFNMLGLAQRLARMLERNAFEALVTLRLVAPYDVVSFASGNIGIPVRLFTSGTFVGNLAVSYWAAALGAALDDIGQAENASGSIQLLISSGVVFALSLVLSRYLRRRMMS